MAEHKVIITDCDHESMEIESRILDTAGISFAHKACLSEDDVVSEGQGATVFLNQYAPITDKVMRSLPDLKLVVRYGVGVNNVDLEAATRHGVQICNVPDYGTHEVADHALALMLALTRKIVLMNEAVHRGEWNYTKSIPIFRHSETTVGVIGVGRIGTAFANKVHALGCQVIGYDPKHREKPSRTLPAHIQLVGLEELLATSDVVSIHCPLDTARNLIDEAELRLMKQTAYLINVSRGGIVNETALDLALEQGWIAGAAADVAEVEPLPSDSPLLRHSQFLCTPHMAWYSEQAALELKRKVAEEAVRFLRGEQVHYPVNQLSYKI